MLEELFELEQRLLGENSKLLQDRSLANLRKYKYSSTDLSPVSKYVLNPFWTWCAGFMPMWLAPNCVTLIGIAAIVLCNLLTLVWAPDMRSDVPRFLYFLYGFSLLWYQTMDNIDGKQARRTGTSSPLGELFDHGIDALNTFWGSVIQVTTLGLGGTWWGLICLVIPSVGMYFSTWETYYTNTLFLGFVNAPTEGLLVAAAAHFVSGVAGGASKFWANPEYAVLGIQPNVWYGITLVSTSIFTHYTACLYNVRAALSDLPDAGAALFKALVALTPILGYSIAVVVWATGPGSIVLGHQFLFGWALSFAFGRMSTTIILCHLCFQPYPRRSLLLIMLYIGAMLYGILPRIGIAPGFGMSELVYLWIYFVVGALYMFGYGKLIIDKLCVYLGIRAFTISTVL